ncbi:hypothetical protein GOZ89_12825 [Agrobacterium vitis]|uniref:Uncharacterized protein n=1 Tax=Agrobacterium vitis TaxID=373 RepID=A0A6A9UM72_AGRVI|nr:hypothetical protein [Agrobacterium vitis]MUZ72014.1 hypothetical protein [Agrobacterium vitis]MUZ95472.1 hypothetical protein [Agrobacterium vitis]MVA31753.1 hypothetical protein [Agrobacterium vitis]MVA36514.1 hypothetical protein [Agrobacterium vitis]MVA55884.1 hypothetical protein [Agrobacterium vitis]
MRKAIPFPERFSDSARLFPAKVRKNSEIERFAFRGKAVLLAAPCRLPDG